MNYLVNSASLNLLYINIKIFTMVSGNFAKAPSSYAIEYLESGHNKS